MRKALMLALSLRVASVNAGLENLVTNSEERVSTIITDNRAIKSQSTGRIPLPKEVCEDFVTRPALLGKIAYAMKISPYKYSTNSIGEITFSDAKGTISTVKYMRDHVTKDTLIKEIEIAGKRYFSEFKAYTDLVCTRDGAETKYESEMYVLLENRLTRWTVKGLCILPYTKNKIKNFFRKEQDSVGKMMANLADKMKSDPVGFLKTLKEGTNNVSFTQKEIETTENYMKKHHFLK